MYGCSNDDFEIDVNQNYTIDEISLHNTRSDCWILIRGRIYDVSTFVKLHPGKDAILSGCGKDATELFETRPMGSRTTHSDYAKTLMNKYYVGSLG